MSELALDVSEPYQVEVVGESAPLGRRLKINGHDISNITQRVRIDVPANGRVEAEIDLVPAKLLLGLKIEQRDINFIISGLGRLLEVAERAARALEQDALKPDLARQVRDAIRYVEYGPHA